MESQIGNIHDAEFQLGIMRNVEREMTPQERRASVNWRLVQNYLLRHTKKAGSTSARRHCEFLGVDPDGYTFW